MNSALPFRAIFVNNLIQFCGKAHGITINLLKQTTTHSESSNIDLVR
jgi:hypothetical protein